MMRRIAVMLHDATGKPITRWFPVAGQARTMEDACCMAMGQASAPTTPLRVEIFTIVQTLPEGMVPKIEGSPWAVNLTYNHEGEPQ